MKIEKLFLPLLLVFSGCVQKMATDGNLRTQQDSELLERVTLHPPTGTVPQTAGTLGLLSAPPVINRDFIKQGQEHYKVFCSPCHGLRGFGDGMVVQRGFPAPPSFHTQKMKNSPDSRYLEVINHGDGTMFGFGDRISPVEQKQITSYIRALQLSEESGHVEGERKKRNE